MSAISQATWCREIALNSLNPFETQGTPRATKHLSAAALRGGRASSPPPRSAVHPLTAVMIPDLRVYSRRLYAGSPRAFLPPLSQAWTLDGGVGGGGQLFCPKPSGAVKASSICCWTKCFVFPPWLRRQNKAPFVGGVWVRIWMNISLFPLSLKWTGKENWGHASVGTFRHHCEVARSVWQMF